LGDEHPDTVDSIKALVDLYEAWGKRKEARKYRNSLPTPVPTNASSDVSVKQPE
jgi:hypothetical protein